jgi:hypothetical protein
MVMVRRVQASLRETLGPDRVIFLARLTCVSHSNPALYLNKPGADGYSMSSTNQSETVQDSTTTEAGETNKATYVEALIRSISDETTPSIPEEPVFQRVLSAEDSVPTQASGRTNSCAVPDGS